MGDGQVVGVMGNYGVGDWWMSVWATIRGCGHREWSWVAVVAHGAMRDLGNVWGTVGLQGFFGVCG